MNLLSFALKNRRILISLTSDPEYKKYQLRLKTFIYDIEQAIVELVKNLVTERSEKITNYLNQARFGLARFYDKQQPDEEE